jgi:hypothetical protein
MVYTYWRWNTSQRFDHFSLLQCQIKGPFGNVVEAVYDAAAEKYLPGDVTPSYGQDTLEQFFRNAVKEGGLAGQELGDAAIFSD